MRRQLPLVLILVSFVGISAASFGQSETKSNLESEVAALTSEVASLREDVTRSQAQIEQMLAYFKNNQRAAAELSRALTASETAGFTFGINPKSRELMLAGWHKQLEVIQKDVPGAATKTAESSQAAADTRFPR